MIKRKRMVSSSRICVQILSGGGLLADFCGYSFRQEQPESAWLDGKHNCDTPTRPGLPPEAELCSLPTT